MTVPKFKLKSNPNAKGSGPIMYKGILFGKLTFSLAVRLSLDTFYL